MIKSHLSRLLGERKLNVAKVAREAGINRKAVTALYAETGKGIDFETLNKLCRYLGCQIGDVLEYLPDKSTKARNHKK